MPVAIVAFYAGINALILLVLAMLVTRQRVLTDTMIGAGERPQMQRAIRAHGNAAENTPILLLLLLLLALGGAATLWLHGLGIALTLGRLLHAWGLSTESGRSFGRFTGMLLTWAAMIVAVVLCIGVGARSL